MLHDTVLIRIRAEYLEMPGLRLKPEQLQRLCGVDGSLCQRVLDALVEVKFLDVNADGAYGRATADQMLRLTPRRRSPGQSRHGQTAA